MGLVLCWAMPALNLIPPEPSPEAESRRIPQGNHPFKTLYAVCNVQHRIRVSDSVAKSRALCLFYIKNTAYSKFVLGRTPCQAAMAARTPRSSDLMASSHASAGPLGWAAC